MTRTPQDQAMLDAIYPEDEDTVNRVTQLSATIERTDTMTAQEAAPAPEVPAVPAILGEAGFSMNWTMLDGSSIPVSLTIRAASRSEWTDVFVRRKALVTMAMEHGWTAQGRGAPPEMREAAPPTAQAQPQASTPPPATAEGATATQTFPAKRMVATVNNGKTYWKLMGGRWAKFGVTIWPETLDAAGFAALDPLKPDGYDMTGWTAHYVDKANEPGKPDKVVQLTR